VVRERERKREREREKEKEMYRWTHALMMHGLSLADCRRRRKRGVTGRARVLARRGKAPGDLRNSSENPLRSSEILKIEDIFGPL